MNRIAEPTLTKLVRNALDNSRENGYNMLVEYDDATIADDLVNCDAEIAEYLIEDVEEAIAKIRLEHK